MNINSDFLTFPFRDERWQNKFLIGGLLALVGSFIWPLLLPISGYQIEVMRRAQLSGELSLPDWDDWGRLFGDGLKAFVVVFVYMLPTLLFYCIGFILMMAIFPAIFVAEQNPEVMVLGIMGQYAGFFMFALGMIPALVLGPLAAVGITRMVATDSLGAAFQFGEVWRLARRGFKHFFLAFVLVMGSYLVLYLVALTLGYTIVLSCLTPFFAAAVMIYIASISGALMGLAYRATLMADIAPPAAGAPAGV